MRTHPRPILVMSKCLELEACRYNGQLIRAPFVLKLLPYVELNATCPEVEIGLGVPRAPIRLVELQGVQRLVQPSSGLDVTDDMQAFSTRFLDSLGEVDGFLLKSRSPSCGIKDTKIRTGPEGDQPSGKGAGMFGGAVLERFPDAAVEDEGRITNFRIRHHFLTKLFLRAAFRTVRASARPKDLVAFHTAQKLTLMAYHQTAMRDMGRIVAGAKGRVMEDVLTDYDVQLARALQRPPRALSNINVLQHAMGYFKGGLTAGEKKHFLQQLDEYRDGRATLAGPLALLQSWIARFEEDYLAGQAYFEPYPNDLLDLRDSGRGS